jgi:hypothetical protein
MALHYHHKGIANAWENVLELVTKSNIVREGNDIFSLCAITEQITLREYFLKYCGMCSDVARIISLLSCYMSCCMSPVRYSYELRKFTSDILKIPENVLTDQYDVDKSGLWFINQVILYGGIYSCEIHSQIDKKYNHRKDLHNLKKAEKYFKKIRGIDFDYDLFRMYRNRIDDVYETF